MAQASARPALAMPAPRRDYVDAWGVEAAPDERLAEAGRRIVRYAGRITNRAPDAVERAR